MRWLTNTVDFDRKDHFRAIERYIEEFEIGYGFKLKDFGGFEVKKITSMRAEFTYPVIPVEKSVTFLGMTLDVKSGYLMFNVDNLAENIGFINLFELLEKQFGCDSKRFLYALESLKFGEIEVKGFLDELKYPDKSLQGGSKVKRLHQSMDIANARNTNIDNYTKIKTLFDNFMIFRRHFLILFNDIDTFGGGDLTRILRTSYKVNRHTALPAPGSIENGIRMGNSRYITDKTSKSEEKYFNLMDLIETTRPDDFMNITVAVDSQLPEEIKTEVKASTLKELLKGAALSGLIKKSSEISYAIDKYSREPNRMLMGSIMLKFASYFRAVAQKIKF